MKLPFFSNKSDNEIVYLGLFLKQDEGVSFLLESGKGGIKILRREKFAYSNGWDKLTEDVDEVLFKIEKETKKTVKETIFFVYSHLIDQKTGSIDKFYLNKIKNLSQNLELKPIGYLECHEAVVLQIEKEEQLSLTAIVLELDKNDVDLFIYKSGRKIYFQKITRTNNIINDLESTLLAIRDKIVLPSRIIIYNSVNLDDLSMQIISYRWRQEIFIQTPRVEIISELRIYQSLVNLFYNQLINHEEKTIHSSYSEEKEVMGFMIGQEVNDTKESLIPPGFSLINQLFRLLRSIKIPKLSINITLITSFILIAVSLFLVEFFLHKADIIVYAPTKEIKKELLIPDSSISIHYATKSAELEVNKIATGKKSIGNNAKGEVTVYSFDDKDKIFPKGTAVELGGIGFILDNEVKVAASTLVADGSAKLPGKTKAKVIASAIGPESNLEKGQRFKISDQPISLFFAINESNFSGGSKKDIKTVAKNDLEDLRILAIDKGKESFEVNKKDSSGKEKMIPDLTDYKLEDLVFSKEVGEEATEVGLKTKIVFSYYGYGEGELLNYLKDEFKKTVPTGYLISLDKIIYKIEKANKEKNIVVLTINAKTKSIKDIKISEVLNKIAGKNKSQLDSIFKNDFSLIGYKLNIKPAFFIIKDKVPFLKRNINLTVSSL